MCETAVPHLETPLWKEAVTSAPSAAKVDISLRNVFFKILTLPIVCDMLEEIDAPDTFHKFDGHTDL